MDKDIRKDTLFAIPAYSKIMPRFFEKRSAILNRLSQLIEEDRPEDPSLYKSCTQLHLDDDESIQWLMRRLANIAAGCINEHNADFLVNHEAHLLSSWVNIMPPGVWSRPEANNQFDWSGIFFAHSEEKKQPDEGVIFLNPFPHKQKWARRTEISFKAQEGKVIIFPSHLTYMLVPHRDSATRLSISFHIKLLPCSPVPSILGTPGSI